MHKLLFTIIFIKLLIINLFGFSTSLDTTMYKKSYKNEILKELKNKNYFLLNKKLIKIYYNDNNYELFFIKNGEIKDFTKNFINILENDEIINSNINIDFNLDKLKQKIQSSSYTTSIETLIETDIMILEIYDKYMKALSKGSINWNLFIDALEKRQKKEVNAHWEKYIAFKNPRYLLYDAEKNNNINIAIDAVKPNFQLNQALSKKIKEFEKIYQNGGFAHIENTDELIKVGNYYPQITNIRKRLVLENYLDEKPCNDDIRIFKDKKIEVKDCKQLYDKELFYAIKKFQKNYGLIIDGIIGQNTINILNTPISDLINKMKLNLERMRWMKRDLGEEYILVNIPDFNLKMYKNDEKILDMPVIVGDKKHPTPIFSHKMSKIVLNPYWKIPQSIVKKEIIPNLVKNPNYLQEEDIRVHENWDHDSIKYDTQHVKWKSFLDSELIGDPVNSPMRFIQIPGDKNPLGRMKFMFPNKYSVYLHDTPKKELFNMKDRALSHGCIRLSKPKELLKIITQKEEIDYDNATNTLKTETRKEFDLKKTIPIHIIYLTSWVNEKGKLQFRRDIYDYDNIQESLLLKTPPVFSASKL